MVGYRYKVLLIDDEPGQLELTRMALEQEKEINIEVAVSAMSGLEMIASDNYDAVVSDYRMPGMNGIDLLRSLRSSGNNIPFLLFTGHSREEIAIAALNEGADFYIRKGMDIESQFAELRNAVVQSIRRKGAETLVAEVFRSSPVLMMVMDGDRRIYAPNDPVGDLAHLPLSDLIGLRCGNAFRCVHSQENELGCGFSVSCVRCKIWAAVRKSIGEGATIRRVKTDIPTVVDGQRKDLPILVSTSPMRAYGRDLALVCIEDLSDIKDDIC